jgi:hypothetical protein
LTKLELGDQLVSYDTEAAVAAYSEMSNGGAERCGCAYCRKFIPQRARAYPAEFLTLLSRLGIDFTKEGEVFHYGPSKDGSQLYGGRFYFVGRLIEAGRRAKTERAAFESGFRYWFSESFPRPPRFFGKNVAALEFVTRVLGELKESP